LEPALFHAPSPFVGHLFFQAALRGRGKIQAMFELRGIDQVARTGLQTLPDGWMTANCEEAAKTGK